MRNYLLAVFALLFSTISIAGVLSDSDIPAMRDALKKAYTPEQCQQDLPGASAETCQCLGEAMAKNLSADKLKQCQKDGYDDCVAAEFTAAKSNLTEEQINGCKALTKASAQPANKEGADNKPATDQPASDQPVKDKPDDSSDETND